MKMVNTVYKGKIMPGGLAPQCTRYSYTILRRVGLDIMILPYYSNVIMSTMVSQITGFSIMCSTVCSGADQRKHQSSKSLDFVRGIHQWPVDSTHKGASNAENISIWWRHHEWPGSSGSCMQKINCLNLSFSSPHDLYKNINNNATKRI